MQRREKVAGGHRRGSRCAQTALSHVYALPEVDPGSPSWEVFADERCLQEHGEVAALHRMLGRIPIDAVSDGRAECES